MFPNNTNAVFLLDSDKESIILIDNPVQVCLYVDETTILVCIILQHLQKNLATLKNLAPPSRKISF